MIFKETKLRGSYVIEPEKLNDNRGFFARTFCEDEFKTHNLVSNFVQSNIAYNLKKNITRGMHYQAAPFEEVKLIRCTKGAICDIIIDLRPESPSHKQWISIKLTETNHKMLYVPKGFAHGYQALEDNTEVSYLVSQFYSPNHERGVRWNDSSFDIQWPETEDIIISDKDKSWSNYKL